jgi:hypothetical protein
MQDIVESPAGKSNQTARRGMRNQRLIALFFLGCLLFNYPLLSLFGGRVAGIPTLYLYLFLVWALFIGLTAATVESSSKRQINR